MPGQPDDRGHQVAERLADRLTEDPPKLAAQMGPSTYGKKALTPDEELLLWRKRAVPPEQEPMLWQQAYAQGMSPEQAAEAVARQVFSERYKLVGAGGRINLAGQAPYVRRMAAKAQAADDAEREQQLQSMVDQAHRAPSHLLVGSQGSGASPPPMQIPSPTAPPGPRVALPQMGGPLAAPQAPPPPAEPPY